MWESPLFMEMTTYVDIDSHLHPAISLAFIEGGHANQESTFGSFPKLGSLYRPPNTIILMIGTPKMVPLTLGNLHLAPQGFSTKSFFFAIRMRPGFLRNVDKKGGVLLTGGPQYRLHTNPYSEPTPKKRVPLSFGNNKQTEPV